MAGPKVLDDTIAAADRAKTVMEGATTALNGVNDRIQAAIAKALENGATAEQLAPIQGVADELTTASDALATAIANVPAE